MSERIGHGTNNEAEYRAAIAGLEAALALGAKDVQLRMDSELIVRQLQHRYRVKNERLIPLFQRLVDLRGRFDSCRRGARPARPQQAGRRTREPGAGHRDPS